MVLAGCKVFTFHDTKVCTENDLAGQFFLNEQDIGKNRVSACSNRLQQLNSYVKVRAAPTEQLPTDEKQLEQEPWNLQ